MDGYQILTFRKDVCDPNSAIIQECIKQRESFQLLTQKVYCVGVWCTQKRRGFTEMQRVPCSTIYIQKSSNYNTLPPPPDELVLMYVCLFTLYPKKAGSRKCTHFKTTILSYSLKSVQIYGSSSYTLSLLHGSRLKVGGGREGSWVGPAAWGWVGSAGGRAPSPQHWLYRVSSLAAISLWWRICSRRKPLIRK